MSRHGVTVATVVHFSCRKIVVQDNFMSHLIFVTKPQFPMNKVTDLKTHQKNRFLKNIPIPVTLSDEPMSLNRPTLYFAVLEIKPALE